MYPPPDGEVLDDAEAFEDFSHTPPQMAPPPLCHQQAVGHRASSSDEFDDSSPVYRSFSAYGSQESYDESPLHRSLEAGPSSLMEDDDLMAEAEPVYRSMNAPAEFWSSPLSTLASLPANCVPANCESVAAPPVAPLDLLLPADLFDLVLCHLPCPDLFTAMLTNRDWCEAAKANYAQRQIAVAAQPDALLECVQRAAPGDTLLLAAGLHMLSREVTIDKPLRLLAAHGFSPATVCSRAHVVVRTRSACRIEGLIVCRLGDGVGYPNTVVYAEAARLSMEDCRVTCGGIAASVEQALCVFDGLPRAGEAVGLQPPCPMDCADAEDRGPDRPQSGVWVGSAAFVKLQRCIICATIGPGIKIYRGELEASFNTITNALRGANVVANGGRATLANNEIHGAVGDGISAWNNADITLQHNRIHSNSGSGLTVNSSGGQLCIANNQIFNNAKAAVSFVTSQPPQALLRDNQLEGGIQGLQASGPLPPQRSGGKQRTTAFAMPVRRDFNTSSSVEM